MIPLDRGHLVDLLQFAEREADELKRRTNALDLTRDNNARGEIVMMLDEAFSAVNYLRSLLRRKDSEIDMKALRRD